MDADGTTVRMTVAQAAGALGISAEAVRQRVRRGTLPTEKSADGSVFVLIDSSRDTERTRTDTNGTDDSTTDKALLAAHLDHALDEIRFLREELVTRNEELRRKDHIIAALTERIPELEAPREARDNDLAASEEPGGTRRGHPVSQEPETQEERRSWLYRFFFGP